MAKKLILYDDTGKIWFHDTKVALEEQIITDKYVDYLLIGGGGSGGVNADTRGGAAGGGAGGFIYITGATITEGSYSIFIGSGGTSSNGGNTIFNGYTAYGGGLGGTPLPWDGSQNIGADGGSGGGGAASIPSYGNIPGGDPIDASQGKSGGYGYEAGDNPAGGGGGGAGSNGSNAGYNTGGNGGNGLPCSITGSEVYYAGGGGGARWAETLGTNGTGGNGGGGNGAELDDNSDIGGSGEAAKGGGGGAGHTAGSGGSGVVIVRLLTSDWGVIHGGIKTLDGEYTVCKFEESGTMILSGSTYTPPTDGLILYVDSLNPNSYPGTGSTIYDLSSYGNDGTIMSGVTYSGNTFVFNDSASGGSYITFGAGAEWGLTETWSYVLWFKPLDSGSCYLLEKSQGQNNLSLVYGYTGEASRPFVNLGYQSLTEVSTPANKWVNLAFCKNTNGAANNYRSYKNGQKQQEISSDFSETSNTDGFRINNEYGVSDIGNFVLSRVLVYNRALTDTEVEQMYYGF